MFFHVRAMAAAHKMFPLILQPQVKNLSMCEVSCLQGDCKDHNRHSLLPQSRGVSREAVTWPKVDKSEKNLPLQVNQLPSFFGE